MGVGLKKVDKNGSLCLSRVASYYIFQIGMVSLMGVMGLIVLL